MTARSVRIRHAAISQHLHETFVSSVLPRVEAHGRIYFRHVRCPHRKEELLAEMAALSWRWFVSFDADGRVREKAFAKVPWQREE